MTENTHHIVPVIFALTQRVKESPYIQKVLLGMMASLLASGLGAGIALYSTQGIVRTEIAQVKQDIAEMKADLRRFRDDFYRPIHERSIR